MFDALKKKLKEGVQRLTAKATEPEQRPAAVRPEPALQEPRHEPVARPKPAPEPTLAERPALEAGAAVPAPASEPAPVEKRGFLRRLKRAKKAAPMETLPAVPEKRGLLGRLLEKELSAADIDGFFEENESALLEADVAVEVVEALRSSLTQQLAKKPIKRTEAKQFVQAAFEQALLEVVDQGSIDIEALLAERKPRVLLFLGFNGAGKTTSIAKTARWLLDRGHPVVLAAGDTFRAAAIDQLEHHGERLGVKVIKHAYGADAAAVIFDARKHAEAKGLHAVLADTAGRTHVDANLLDELRKIVRVNKPDLRILVVDSLTGNDAVEQARKFNEAVGVDAVFLTKMDVNRRGGALLSVCYAIKKPVLFLGTGQGYGDVQLFEPRAFVQQLIEQ